LDLACQAYPFALDVVRLTERQDHPDRSPEELAWRATRRMQGDRNKIHRRGASAKEF
jgi:hypothetical protein